MPYKIQVAHSASRALEKLPNQDRMRIQNRIDELARNPRPPGVKKLAGEKNLFRVRSGDYRVYIISDRELVVLVLRVGHRSEVYDRL